MMELKEHINKVWTAWATTNSNFYSVNYKRLEGLKAMLHNTELELIESKKDKSRNNLVWFLLGILVVYTIILVIKSFGGCK